MAITISGQNNNDRILASDGVLDQISGFNVVGVMTASTFEATGEVTANHIDVGSSIQLGNAGIITATTLIGNVTGNVNSTSNLLLQISGSEKFRVGNGGQLGIGGANYGTAGQVLTSGGSGSAATWSTIASDKISEDDTEAEVYDVGSNTARFTVKTEGSERLRITSDGKMGVGTASPNRTLTVQSNGGQMSINDTDNTNGGIFCNAGNFAFYARGNSNLGDGSVGGVLTVQTHTAGGSTAERLRITSTGDINVSTAATIKANGNATFSGIATAAGFALGDNDKITFGASEDLSVLHSGSTGVINNVTGDLHIKTTGSGDDIVLISNDDIELQPQAGEDGIKVIGNGAVELYHDSTKKFETASHGITVSGEIRDDRGNIRDIQSEPLSGTHSSRTLVDADAGKVVVMSGGVTLPAASGGGPFGGGSTLTILNKSGSAITLTQASGLTLYNTADATTGNRTLAARGIATVYYMYGGNEAYISGSGLS